MMAAGPSLREIHLWLAPAGAVVKNVHFEDLPAEEVERARSFTRRERSEEFLSARRRLRRLLGWYLGLPQGFAGTIAVEENGRPHLTEGDLHFSLSHARDWHAFAFSGAGAVGVDVQHAVSGPQAESLGESVFHPEECEAFSALPESLQSDFFLRLWTRKEALSKSLGLGLRAPFKQWSVMNSDRPWIEGRRFQLESFVVGDHHVSVAREETFAEVRWLGCLL